MKALFETDFLQKNIFASNEKFLGFYKSLVFDLGIKKPQFTVIEPTESNVRDNADLDSSLKLSIRSLKLLDGKWGNFFYNPEKGFLVVSASVAAIDYHKGFSNSLYIYSFERPKKVKWDYLTRSVNIFNNFNHKKDESEERQASAFARNCVRKVASINDPVSVVSYLNGVSKSRERFC